MKLKIPGILFLAILFFTECSDHKKSRIVSFEYGTYEDTSCALLYGQVYELNPAHHSNDSLRPLANVVIKTQDSVKKNFTLTTITNSKGQFLISTDEGIFNLTVTKKGYQTIKFTNYMADPGRISKTKIILEKEQIRF
ncbi:MAG TPA: carboxypeptidase-like regulatory domain-containing protein [Chitinophagaceae bacterium]|jgi:hypothetical protein